MTMRLLLEFALVSAVCTHNVSQVKRILVYGRENTFLLSVTDSLLQIALRLTEDDGPLRGDHSILRVLICNATVIKPIASPRRQRNLKRTEQKAEKKLIKMMKVGLGMRLNKKTQRELDENDNHQRLMIDELSKL